MQTSWHILSLWLFLVILPQPQNDKTNESIITTRSCWCSPQVTFSTNCTGHMMWITEHCILHCTMYSVHSTLYTAQFTLYNSNFILYSVHCTGTPYSVKCILYTVHCTLYTVHCTLYTENCTLYTVKYHVNCTFYTVQSMYYGVNCILCSVDWLNIFFLNHRKVIHYIIQFRIHPSWNPIKYEFI